MSHRILIVGASGFIGNALYKELCSFHKTIGTYCCQKENYSDNQAFYRFDATTDNVGKMLFEIKPTLIISCFRSSYPAEVKTHIEVIQYIKNNKNCRIVYISSVRVFDGNMLYPVYEDGKPLAETLSGKNKILIEKQLQELPAQKYAIVRLPMVLGVNCRRISQLKETIKNNHPFEVFPNLVINVTTITKVCQQIQYLINQKSCGIFHLGSNDLIHHNDLFQEISEKLSLKKPVFKYTYTTNENRFLAVLPKHQLLPKELQTTTKEVIKEITLNEKSNTLKKILS